MISYNTPLLSLLIFSLPKLKLITIELISIVDVNNEVNVSYHHHRRDHRRHQFNNHQSINQERLDSATILQNSNFRLPGDGWRLRNKDNNNSPLYQAFGSRIPEMEAKGGGLKKSLPHRRFLFFTKISKLSRKKPTTP